MSENAQTNRVGRPTARLLMYVAAGLVVVNVIAMTAFHEWRKIDGYANLVVASMLLFNSFALYNGSAGPRAKLVAQFAVGWSVLGCAFVVFAIYHGLNR